MTNEELLITTFYGDKKAQRSQVPLINHIKEGMIILDAIGASGAAKVAFCIHPVIQDDEPLKNNLSMVVDICSPYVILLAMEYRSVANEYLSEKVGTGHKIRLSPLKEVNDMLIADKVQNYKDFNIYHRGTHPRSEELIMYFNDWFAALGVSNKMYKDLRQRIIDESK